MSMVDNQTCLTHDHKGGVMRNPLWIFNSALVFIGIAGALLLIYIPTTPPPRVPLKQHSEDPAEEASSRYTVNVKRIYENDIFGTHIEQTQPTGKERKKQARQIHVPQPPPQKQPSKEEPDPPQFLEPLQVSLKGVIFNSYSAHSRAIISDIASKQEQLYKIGDKIQDAHLIYIGPQKAVLLRSNGQQETLFVSQEAAEQDAVYQQEQWSSVIEATQDNIYTVYADAFTRSVRGISDLVHRLDVTSAFEKGAGIGLHVGPLKQGSLGHVLGLQHGDIITKINDASPTSTQKRSRIYRDIQKKGRSQDIVVTIQRDGQQKTLTYHVVPQKDEQSGDEIGAEQYITTPNRPISQRHHGGEETAQTTIGQEPTYTHLARKNVQNDRSAMHAYGGKQSMLQR